MSHKRLIDPSVNKIQVVIWGALITTFLHRGAKWQQNNFLVLGGKSKTQLAGWLLFLHNKWSFLRLWCKLISYYGPTQVKCRLLISSIFYAMNFRHFLEMLEFNLWHFCKMSEIHCIKNSRNQESTFDLRWAYDVKIHSSQYN